MPRVQTGLRVDPHVFPIFKELCAIENYGPGNAVEQFMRAVVEAKSVTVALNGAQSSSRGQQDADKRALERTILDLESLVESSRIQLSKSDPFHQCYQETPIRKVMERAERILPRVEDPDLRSQAASTLIAATNYIRDERLRTAQQSFF